MPVVGPPILEFNNSAGTVINKRANDGTGSVETYSAWQQTRFVEADFRGKTDSLREGEPIRVVLINRATGYIGTAYSHIEVKETESSQVFDQYGIGLNLGDITLTPPNLKVNVKRSYKVKQGLTQGERRDYRVGSEGAGLHSDEYILVTTDWRDQDGSPLPSGLPGYTGRITSLSGHKTLADNAVGHFEVKPGLHTEYIALPNADSAVAEASYQYIHIVGEQLTDSPDFSASDATHNRPTKYVPLKVAVYDETASRALKAAQLENPDNTLEQDSSVYQWVYRPEMMYAVFDLDVTQFVGIDSEGHETSLEGDGSGGLHSNYDSIEIVQDLSVGDYDPLDYFGPDSELVYSFEGSEHQVNPGSGNTYVYTDLGALSELDSDDFISLNLLNNQDAGNILSEWVTVRFEAGVDLNRDGVITFDRTWYTDKSLENSCDVINDDESNAVSTDLTAPGRPYRFWLNNDYDVVSNLGIPSVESMSCDGLESAAPERVFEQKCELSDAWIRNANSPTNTSDNNRRRIENFRDLEDLVPLDLRFDRAALEKLKSGDIKLLVQGDRIDVDLFPVIMTGEGSAHRYQWDQALAQSIIEGSRVTPRQVPVYTDKATLIRSEVIGHHIDETNRRLSFLLEGVRSDNECLVGPNECSLTFSLAKKGDVIAKSTVYLNLRDVRDFYDQANAGDAEPAGFSRDVVPGGSWNTYPGYSGWDNQAIPLIGGESTGSADQALSAGTQRSAKVQIYSCVAPKSLINQHKVVHVHGWRMTREDKHNFASTAFKRLYWSGYQGGFASFEWPTGWFLKPGHNYGLDQGPAVAQNAYNYGTSEVAARRSGRVLGDWLTSKKGSGQGQSENLHVVAHSMGNIVVSEMLREKASGFLTSYSASESAEAAGSYDPTLNDMRHKSQVTKLNNTPESAWRTYNDNSLLDNPYDMPVDIYRFNSLTEGTVLSHGETNTQSLRTIAGVGARPYYAGIGAAAGRMVSYFNENDAALNGWEFQQLSKPDGLKGWGYANNQTCAGVFSFQWPDGSVCDKSSLEVESRFYHDDVQINPIDWDSGGGLARFDILARIVPARTRALGRVDFTSPQMPNDDDGNIDNRALRTPANADSSLIQPVEVLGGTTSNFDHSLQYHGYLMEKRMTSEGVREFRAGYWSDVLGESIRLEDEDYSSLGDVIGNTP